MNAVEVQVVCSVCGIAVIQLKMSGLYIHAEPRTLANRLHNGTADHNAVVAN